MTRIDMSDDELENAIDALKSYQILHDRLSDMIESGRLTEADIPDDYQWLVRSLADLAALPINN